MIQLFNKIEELKNELNDSIDKKRIKDYRLFLRINDEISIYIICDNKDNIFEKYSDDDNINFEIINSEEVESDRFYKNIFKDKQKIDTKTTRRRFSNLLDSKNTDDYKPPCPVVTYYSYKGGMGRSTTVAITASYLALRKKQKIVIIDCDFEAPGFTNFFLEEPFYNKNQSGFVEYIFDAEFLDEKPNLNNYLWEVADHYSGDGEIHIMPAGNLDDEIQIGKLFGTHKQHYLEGLARIDFASTEYIVEKFHNLISEIHKEIEPDIILIDSRTGFTDIFGLTALKSSNLAVGFFGNNVQNLPGLHFFIDFINDTNKKDFRGIIMNSFSHRKAFESFEAQIEDYINQITPDDENEKNPIGAIEIKKFFFGRHAVLEKIGTFDEVKEDFIDFINYSIEKGFIDLINEIYNLIDNRKQEKNKSPKIKIVGKIDLSKINKIQKRKNNKISKDDLQKKLKKEILTKLIDENTWPDLYPNPDKINFNEEYKKQRYFFRECMEDLFNLNKMLILGGKGTGKTYIYLSLKNKDIATELKKRANKTKYEYVFFHLIDYKENLFIDTNEFDNYEIKNPEIFYKRFWLLYTWNAIMHIANKKGLNYKSPIETIPLTNNIENAKKYFDIINNNNKIIEIENDLAHFDNYMKSEKDKYVILLYDDLDEIVKSHKWHEKIAPLLNFWKRKNYSKIYPKLFVRRDLFNKISGVTNIKDLENQAIKIEWEKEEIFAYFFKLVFSVSKKDFFDLMELYNDYPNSFIENIKKESENDNQILNERYLRALCTTFFGEHTGDTRHGDSYDWFYRNLSNADKTISIRPFIDLIGEAINYCIKEDGNFKPILPPFYYTHRNARAKAIERYFDDLAQEKGNTDLQKIFKSISQNPKFQFYEFNNNQFDNLLHFIIQKYPNIENQTKDELTKLLIINGIIRETPYRGGSKFTFAYLYKYKLGLKNRYKKLY